MYRFQWSWDLKTYMYISKAVGVSAPLTDYHNQCLRPKGKVRINMHILKPQVCFPFETVRVLLLIITVLHHTNCLWQVGDHCLRKRSLICGSFGM